LLELIRTGLGYCSQCRFPKWVAVLKVQGWPHEFGMCSECIAGLAKRTADAMPHETKEM